MNNRQKETLNVRIISVGFSCLAFVVFKPMAIGQLGLMLYVWFLLIWLFGIGVCYVTEAVMKYIVNMPATLDRGVDYIIRRNLCFQLINTPLEALLTCCVLHFPLSRIGAPDLLSVMGFLQTLFILAFCSFAVGLYWRYKFRSRYLAAELEETKMLNEQLKEHPQSLSAVEDTVTLIGTTSETVTLCISELLYIEAVGNYVKIYQHRDGQVRCDMLRSTSKQLEQTLQSYPSIVRCHRAFLVNLSQVEQVLSRSGVMQLLIRHSHDSIPVSRSNMAGVKKAIKNI